MQNMIKLTAFLFTLALSLTTAFAQYDDDIFYSPSAEKKAQEAALKATMWSTDANDEWDVDGYNRRYSSTSTGANSASKGSANSTLTSLNKNDRDTVYIIKEKYYYSYADLLYRFHSGFYRPSWYWHTAWGWGDPFYWDRWYNDPFYWDSYYYGGWGWSWGWGGVHVAWHTPIHYHHYGWRPAPHHHHYTPIHRLPAHRSGGHSVIRGGGNHGYYHSPVIARGGNRHSGARGGDGSRHYGQNNSGSRGRDNGVRGRDNGVRGGNGSRNNSYSQSHNNSSHSNSSRGSYSGGGRSGGGGGHFGGGGGHFGGGGGRGRR